MNNWKVRSFRSSCVYRRGCSTLAILENRRNSTFRIHNGFLWNSFLSWRKRKKRIRCILKGWVPFFSMSSEKNYHVLPVSTRDYFLEFLFHDRCKQCFRENLYRNLYLANTFLTSSLKKKLLWKTEPVFLKLFFRGK